MKCLYKPLGVSLVAVAGLLGPLSAGAANTDPLRICAAADELPFSKSDGSGFENEIAKIVADGMGREAEFVYADEPGIYLVPKYLKKDKCDVITGVDADDPRVATTEPYYRSSYVFVYPQGENVEVDSWDSADLQKMTRFAISPYSPVEPKLRDMNKWDDNLNYMYSLIGFKSRRNEYVRYAPEKLLGEVIDGEADIAIVWGPEVARYVQQAQQPLTMKRVPDTTTRRGEDLKFSYAQAMAVRPDDTELLDALNTALDEKHAEIRTVLKTEGMPLMNIDDNSDPRDSDAQNNTGAAS